MTTSRIRKIIDQNDLVLMEGGVIEILRRSGNVAFHSDLIHTPLIYDINGSNELKLIFRGYLDIANKSGTPFIICTPTWRANKENVYRSGLNTGINIDSVKFIENLLIEYPELINKVLIGGTIGPKNDCYKPDEGLTSNEAQDFHSWQIAQLKEGGVDFVIAETIPNVNEALGIAKACSELNIDYVVSFVISRNGKILDQTNLQTAIDLIDNEVVNKPLGYFVNCAHPSFFCANNQPKEIFNRILGFLGNASDLDHCDLDNAIGLHVDDIVNWGNEMLKLNHEYGVKILGGCCGTNANHIDYLRKNKITHHNV